MLRHLNLFPKTQNLTPARHETIVFEPEYKGSMVAVSGAQMCTDIMLLL